MGITAGFVIKHVRPWGIEAITVVCDPEGDFVEFMENVLEIPHGTTGTLVNYWADVGMTAVNNQNLPFFLEAARNVSTGRWEELYPTALSTVLFMDKDALAHLSNVAGNNPSDNNQLRHFHVEFDAGSIPLAITINQNPNIQPIYDYNVVEISVGVDSNGNCAHFGGVV